MKDIMFIYPPYEKRIGGGNLFPLGMGYLISGIHRRGFSCDYLLCQDIYRNPSTFVSDLIEKIKKESFQLLAISCITTAAIPFMSDIIAACRKTHPQTPIILGGPLVSIDYVEELFFSQYDIDAICKGDGDYVIAELIAYIKSGRDISLCDFVSTPKRRSTKHTISDIDHLPFPYRDYSIVSKEKLSFSRSTYAEKTLTMIASRGCVYHCNYCVSGCTSNRSFRKRSWKNVVEEIKWVQEQFDIYSYVFYDDCFFAYIKRVNEDIEEFISEIRAQNCKDFVWQMEIRADIVLAISTESWKKLYAHGCRQISIGIESCYDDTLKFLGKNYTIDTIKAAFAHLQSSVPEIITRATYIIGGPNSDSASIKYIADFSKEMHLMYIRIHPLELHPGTYLYEQYYGHGDNWYQYIISNENPHSCMYFEQDADSLDRIFSDIKDTYRLFYNSDYWTERAQTIYGEKYGKLKEEMLDTFALEE